MELNMKFLYFLAELRTEFLNNIFRFITHFGEEIALIVFLCIIYWCVNKRLGCEMGFSFCLSGLLVQGLKIIFRVDRPWIYDKNFNPVEGTKANAGGYSFPSGHTQSATSVYGTGMINAKKNWMKILYISLFVLVGFSRLYLGVHTPQDVIVSMALTLAVVFFVHRAFEDPKKLKILLITMMCVCVALFILADSLYLAKIVETKYVKNCCQSIGAALGFVVGYLFENKYVKFEEKKPFGIQLGKVIIGLAAVVVLKLAFGKIFPNNLIGYTFEYFLLILFIVLIYPVLFEFTIREYKAIQENNRK